MRMRAVFVAVIFLFTLFGDITQSENSGLASDSWESKTQTDHLRDANISILEHEVEVAFVDNIGVHNSKANVGEFNIGLPILKVTDGWGCAGSFGNIIQMNFENEFHAMGIQFDLLFDTTLFNVSHIEKTNRTNHLSIFSWSSRENGIRMVMTNFEGISQGKGSIAYIYFDVNEITPPGNYELSLSHVVTADMHAYRYEVSTVDGSFHVVLRKGDVNGDGVVSIEDVITTVDIIIGYYEPTEYEFAAADCNDDDEINILDVVFIVNVILGTGDEEKF